MEIRQSKSMYVSAIQIYCVLINIDVFVSSVCLEDVTLFIRRSQSCAFRKVDFDNIFNESNKRCHIDCSPLSTTPPYSNMKGLYNIKEIKINLGSNSNGLVLQNSCWLNFKPPLYIVIGCEGHFIKNRRIGERCVSDIQCKRGTTYSICNETNGFCQCKAGYLFWWESNTCSPVKRETDKTEHSGLVIGVGVAGLVLGVSICGFLYFIGTHYKKKCQIRCNKEIRKEASVQGLSSLTSKPIDNEEGNYDVGRDDLYSHLHETGNVCVQPDYDHVPQHDRDDDDYSHMKTCNANQVDSSGEYGVIR